MKREGGLITRGEEERKGGEDGKTGAGLNESPKGIKWSAVPLPCLTKVFQFDGFWFSLLKQGNGPGRGRSPVEWGDFPSIRPSPPRRP